MKGIWTKPIRKWNNQNKLQRNLSMRETFTILQGI